MHNYSQLYLLNFFIKNLFIKILLINNNKFNKKII